MAPDDFDIDSLAKYLHLPRAKIARMADRGKLPGRRIGGQWRFARAEIHHWIEDRIGASDEDELIEVEDVLRRSKGAGGKTDVSIARLLPLEAIATPLAARTRHSVIAEMTALAARTGLLWNPEKMADAVRARETLHPTALDNGVALLHPRRPMPSILAEAFLALGRTQHGIPFGGDHGALTDLFFLICSTEDRGHLKLLARLSRLLADPGLLSAIRQAPDAAAVRQLIVQQEQGLQA